MKKTFILAIIIFSGTSILAQRGTAAVKLGFFNPAASDGGFIVGFEGGRAVDQHFGFGWSIDWFHRNYVDKRLVEEFNHYYDVTGSINELRAETNLHDFPVMVHMIARFPVAHFTKVYFTGGIGAEVMIINYNNFFDPSESEMHAAFDFNWRVGTGIIYEAGRFTDFMFEIAYHSSEPSWEYEVEGQGTGYRKRTFERSFDMSGLMARFGVKFYY